MTAGLAGLARVAAGFAAAGIAASGCSLSLELEGPQGEVVTVGGGTADAGGGGSGGAGGAGGSADGAVPDAERPAGGPCQDKDGDQRGPGCALGADCDDTDARVHADALERCNGTDDDCDGRADEDWPTLGGLCTAGLGTCARPGSVRCAPSAAGIFCDSNLGRPQSETCDGLDNDCDGLADEGVRACCQPLESRACGVAVGTCRTGRQRCDADQAWGPCDGVAPASEVCNGADDDCDGLTDEGVTNPCGACGPAPPERCDGIDDDCDGQVDEGSLNPCRACGAIPEETCDGTDEDCDGQVDEGACHMYVLKERPRDPAMATWTTRTGGSLGPFTTDQTVQALAASVETDEVWAITESEVWFYNVFTDTWDGRLPRAQVFPGLPAGVLSGAMATPAWWLVQGGGPEQRRVDLNLGATTYRFSGALGARTLALEAELPLDGAWLAPQAPNPDRIADIFLDLRNGSGWWVGDPSTLCQTAATTLSAVGVAVLDNGRLNIFEAGHCFVFMGERAPETWHPFTMPGAPAPDRILGIAHFDFPSPGEDRALKVVVVR